MSHDLFFEDYMRYMRNAWLLEQQKLGVPEYIGVQTNDYLMDNVPIYDVTDRQYAGINDVLQDLWFADDPVGNPKAKLRTQWPAQPTDRANPNLTYLEQLKSYRSLKQRWGDNWRVWLYVWMVHRITGSGASYVDDHGYRNSIIPELAQFNTVSEMADFIHSYTSPLYTSGGCQIPGFPKAYAKPIGSGIIHEKAMTSPYSHLLKNRNYDIAKGQGKLFLCEMAPIIVDQIASEFEKIDRGERKRFGHKTTYNSDKSVKQEGLMDFVCEYNKRNRFNKFAFQYALFAADVSDYLPQYVSPVSHVHYGTNSVKALKVLTQGGKSKNFDNTARKIKLEFLNRYNIKLKYKGIENSLCDYTKYLKEQVPDVEQLNSSVDVSLLKRHTGIVSRELGQSKGFP